MMRLHVLSATCCNVYDAHHGVHTAAKDGLFRITVLLLAGTLGLYMTAFAADGYVA